MNEALAWIFVIAMVCVPLVSLAVWLRSSPYSVVQSIFCLAALLLVRLQWRAQLPRGLPIPPGSGAVLLSNHRSSIDPFFVQVVAGRVVHWMVAREYCEHPAFRWFLNACEVIPVNRGGIDTASTKQAIRYAEQGGVVGMFPEGRINMTEDFMMPCRPGAVMIAIKANVPIVPVYIEGSPYRGTPWSPFLMRAFVRVRFGAPIHMGAVAESAEDPDGVRVLMCEALQAIASLAGRRDHQPVLAGRKWKPEERGACR